MLLLRRTFTQLCHQQLETGTRVCQPLYPSLLLDELNWCGRLGETSSTWAHPVSGWRILFWKPENKLNWETGRSSSPSKVWQRRSGHSVQYRGRKGTLRMCAVLHLYPGGALVCWLGGQALGAPSDKRGCSRRMNGFSLPAHRSSVSARW